MENTLNGKSKERWRWFDHPPVQPLLWRVQSLVPAMLISRRLSREGQPGSIKGSAFEVLEPYAGKLACTVLRGAGGPLAYSAPSVPRLGVLNFESPQQS